MKYKLFLVLTLLHLSVLSAGQESGKVELENFNRFLGREKAAVLDDAVDSFDRFLRTNYPDFENDSARTTAFLRQIAGYNAPSSAWVLETDKNREIVRSFETTGLRKEIWIYDEEAYEPKHDFSEVLPPPALDTAAIEDLGELELDLIEEEIVPLEKDETNQEKGRKRKSNFLRSNYNGDYLYALLKYSAQDSFVYEFAEAEYFIGNISPGVVANAFFDNEINYSDPLVKRILVTEFYFLIMKWDINRKK